MAAGPKPGALVTVVMNEGVTLYNGGIEIPVGDDGKKRLECGGAFAAMLEKTGRGKIELNAPLITSRKSSDSSDT